MHNFTILVSKHTFYTGLQPIRRMDPVTFSDNLCLYLTSSHGKVSPLVATGTASISVVSSTLLGISGIMHSVNILKLFTFKLKLRNCYHSKALQMQ